MKNNYKPRFKVIGPGILTIESSELIKTEGVKRQIEALKKLKKEGVIITNKNLHK